MSSPRQSPYTNGTWGQVLAWTQVAQVIVVPALAWLLLEVIEMRGNRFTSKDGLDVWQRIAAIEKEIAGLPPTAFRAKVERLEQEIHAIAIDLAKIKAR